MPKVEVSCKQCGNKKLVFPSHVYKVKYGNFCNKDCLGLFRTAKLTGTLAANFKTGDARERDYVIVHAPWHPNVTSKNKVYLHRLVVEARLGRYLTKNEIVHHKDHNPENNHWDNLEVMTQSEHAREHFTKTKRGEN